MKNKNQESKYVFENGIYYMTDESGEKIPIDIDAPPGFKANMHGEMIIASVLQRLRLQKGTIVKVNGIPFKLIEDTSVLGTQENLQLTKKFPIESETAKDMTNSNDRFIFERGLHTAPRYV